MEDLRSIKIGSVVLDHLMWWTDEFQFLAKTTVAERTIAGNMVTQSFPKLGGRPITLAGDNNHGFQSRRTVESLISMLESGDESFVVEFRGTGNYVILSLNCRFRQEDDPALSFTPCVPVDNPDDYFWYTGTIKLVTL